MKEIFYVFLDIDGVLWNEEYITFLRDNNIPKNNDIETYLSPQSRLKNIDMPRGLEIKKYLKQNKNSKNYVVIDDEVKDIKPFIKRSNIIDVKNEGLQKYHIEKFLKAKNIVKNLNENER